MAAGDACGVRLRGRELPLLPGAEEAAAMGLVPEGARRNRDGRLRCVRNAAQVPPVLLDLLFDPQTSGGLLAALPAAAAPEALAALREAGAQGWIVGSCGGPAGSLEILL
jgi:selenide,water dikinase